MPRRAKYPPVILRIENLSTGIDTALRDDFTGELIPQPGAKPVTEFPDELRAMRRAELAKASRLVMQRIGLLPQDPKPQLPPMPGRHVIGWIGDQVMTMPNPKWRRI